METIYLKDIWPKKSEVDKIIEKSVKNEMYKKNYKTIFNGDDNWKKLTLIIRQPINGPCRQHT